MPWWSEGEQATRTHSTCTGKALSKRSGRGQKLRGVPAIRLNDAAELTLAANRAMCLWLERFVEHFVVHTDASMGSLRVVIMDPGLRDVVKLVKVEADEVVQAFPFMRFDPGFCKRIRLWRPDRRMAARIPMIAMTTSTRAGDGIPGAESRP